MVQDDPLPIKRANIKESFLTVDLSGDNFGSTSQCELYVDYDSSIRFIALGKFYEGVIVLHNVPFPSKLIKVTVEKVLYGDVAVLVSTLEVTIVAEALHTFIS